MKAIKDESESEDDSLYNIESLNDLVTIAYSFKKKPVNSDLEKLWKIKKSLQKLNNLVGLETLKKRYNESNIIYHSKSK